MRVMAARKKIFAVSSILILTAFLSGPVFAQEADDLQTEAEGAIENPPEAEIQNDEVPEGFIHTLDFIMEFEASLYLNPEYKELNSAPSPINFQPSIGLLWPNYSVIAVQPTLSFFYMNHLWYEDRALPAEIENRTSTTLSFLLQIPAVFTIFLKDSRFQFSLGPAIMLRFAYLAHGVSATDTGYTGSAASDISKMNSWFWSDGRWFYLSAGANWLYHITSQLRAGPTITANIPVGGLISDHSLQGLTISTGIKICR